MYLITEANGITTGANVSCHFATMKLNNLAFYFRLFCKGGGKLNIYDLCRFLEINTAKSSWFLIVNTVYSMLQGSFFS